MRRTGRRTVILTTVLSFVLTAAPAVAQYPGGGQPPPTVRGEKFFRGGTARTGADVRLFVIIALVLLALGVLAYLASRRTARRDG